MHLDGERWERVQHLFHEALGLTAGERRGFLESACGGDRALLAEVLSLLEEDARPGLLDRDLGAVAHDVLEQTTPPMQFIGPYRIRGILGQGGMGVVYSAEREDLGSRAAIKVLRDAWLSPARRERFASEQRVLAQLNHPLIARLYDADVLPDGTPYFVMEYVEGEPLTRYCSTHGSSMIERLQLFRAVCEAVQYAHREAVIHRDIKPSNVLVTSAGTIKLLDFGIARQLDNLDSPADPTVTGLRLMTPAYAAPEQMLGAPVGTYTDIYALGVVLYELLAGRLPFDLSRSTPGQAETVIVEQEPDRPSVAAHKTAADGTSVVPAVSARAWADLDVLCLTAMHKDPQRRYRTVDALVRDVDHYLKGEPLEARPDAFGYRLGKWLRRNWRPVTAAAAMLVLVVTLVVFYTLRLAGARDAALAEAARTQRIQRFMLDLFQGGDAAAGPADSLRVVALLDRGVQEARVLEGEPALQAELFQTLGTVYQQLGNLERADTLLQAALERRRALFGQDHEEVSTSLVALGMLRLDQAELEEAEGLIRQGLDADRRRLAPDHPRIVEAMGALGRVLQAQGKYDGAIALFEQTVRAEARRSASSLELSTALTDLANTHFYAGRYSVSDSLNRLVLEMDRKLYGEHHPMVATDLINLGAIQSDLGNYAAAEGYHRQALQIVEAYWGPEHFETASTLTMIGRALIPQKRYAEALVVLRRALAIQERVFGPVHPRVASALNEIGNATSLQGDPAAAMPYFRRMADIYRSVYGERHYLVGIAHANLATQYFELGQYPRAESLLRDVLALYADALPPGHQNIAIARIKLARTLMKQNRWRDAEKELLAATESLSSPAGASRAWLKNARTELVSVYEALGQSENAQKYRAQLAATDSAAG